MGVTVAVARTTCSTSNGTQDITTSDLGGLTPKAAIVMVTGATSDATAADNSKMSYALTDGTRYGMVSVTSAHNVDTSNERNRLRSNSTIVWIEDTSEVIEAQGDFSAWITNGIRINWVDAPPSAWFITVVFFAGTDLSAYVGVQGVGDTVDLETNITSVGFQPNVVIGLLQGSGVALSDVRFPPGAGFCHFDGSSTYTQRCRGWWVRDAQGTSSVLAQSFNQYTSVQINTVGALDVGIELGSFDSQGFSLWTRNAGGNTNNFVYLAMNFNSVVSSAVGTYTTPTSTGSHSETSLSFTPQAVLMLPGLVEAYSTAYSDNRAGTVGNIFITENTQVCDTISNEDNVDVTNTQSLSDNVAVIVPDDDGTLDIEATFSTFTSSGWTLSYSNVSTTGKIWPFLAIGSGTVADTLTGSDVLSGTPTLDSPTIGQTHVISATEITSSTPTIDASTVSEIVSITASDLTSGIATLDSSAIYEATFLRPSSDITVGNWTPSTGSTLYETIDEVVASDVDYMRSESEPSSSLAEVGLQAQPDPSLSVFHVVRYRYRKSGSATINLVFYLMEGTTQRATWTHNNVSDVFTTGEYILSGAEADSITNYSNLRVRIVATEI